MLPRRSAVSAVLSHAATTLAGHEDLDSGHRRHDDRPAARLGRARRPDQVGSVAVLRAAGRRHAALGHDLAGRVVERADRHREPARVLARARLRPPGAGRDQRRARSDQRACVSQDARTRLRPALARAVEHGGEHPRLSRRALRTADHDDRARCARAGRRRRRWLRELRRRRRPALPVHREPAARHAAACCRRSRRRARCPSADARALARAGAALGGADRGATCRICSPSSWCSVPALRAACANTSMRRSRCRDAPARSIATRCRARGAR